jgi:hypothetical protein
VLLLLLLLFVLLSRDTGCAIAQAVSRWLPTAAARVRARVWSYGISGGQSGAGAGFLRVLRSPLPIFIPPIAPQSPSSIIWGLYNRPEVDEGSNGLSPTPLIIIIIRSRDMMQIPVCYGKTYFKSFVIAFVTSVFIL